MGERAVGVDLENGDRIGAAVGREQQRPRPIDDDFLVRVKRPERERRRDSEALGGERRAGQSASSCRPSLA